MSPIYYRLLLIAAKIYFPHKNGNLFFFLVNFRDLKRWNFIEWIISELYKCDPHSVCYDRNFSQRKKSSWNFFFQSRHQKSSRNIHHQTIALQNSRKQFSTIKMHRSHFSTFISIWKEKHIYYWLIFLVIILVRTSKKSFFFVINNNIIYFIIYC